MAEDWRNKDQYLAEGKSRLPSAGGSGAQGDPGGWLDQAQAAELWSGLGLLRQAWPHAPCKCPGEGWPVQEQKRVRRTAAHGCAVVHCPKAPPEGAHGKWSL